MEQVGVILAALNTKTEHTDTMYKHPAHLIFIALFLLSCGKNTIPQSDALSRKTEPYEMFSFQRSYPYPDFDWAGWRKTLQQTRIAETAQARQLNCGSNVTAWTQQGPMNVGGRCNALAAKPDDENTVLAGFSGGGIFKSIDGAVNWHPVFDDNPELAIGDISFDPSNPNIVYAGTGDPNVPLNVFNGDGIYKSTDAGESWQHLANSPTGIVSKIIVHPSNPAVIWAATMGNPYVRDNQRGIYKSTDGGNSWQQVLFVSDQAGASDLVQSSSNPQILYASFWDRIRNNFESVIYGPHARVYKSTDGGDTWVQLGGGLPTGTNGRTGLAISYTNPDKLYVLYMDSLSTPGSLHKTTDGGLSWTPVNIIQLEDACSDFGWYFGKIRTNPNDDEELYFLAVQMWRKPAGNPGWFNAGSGHADSHDLIFTASGRRYWATDGGVYRNDGQATWVKALNLPVTQFYRTNFNPHEPNLYWAGAQDNGIQKGSGLNPNNWQSIFTADGFNCAFDPADAMHFWVETQNGVVHETTDGGMSWQFGSQGLSTSDRTNWDTPIFMSPHMPNRLYGGTYRAYAKDAGGGWGTISGDLTDGNIFGARFHTVSCINESPVTMNKLVAGSSDGNVWRREPAGAWTNITAGLPDRYVTSVYYSPTQSNRLFVSHSGFRDNENIPHIHRSDDNGSSWQDISADLPQMPVNDLFILPGQQDQVLFAATDAGVYFTLNGGIAWKRLGGNMPYIPVFDLAHNPVRKELVAATFARGIWTFPIDSVFVQQNPVIVSLAGTLRDEMDAGVVEVNVEGALSDDSGVFNLQNVPGCAPFTLAPYRNDNPLNGVTTYDLVLISKHILGLEPFNSPYKMIAADANHSGSITTFDIVQLRKLILGIDTAFTNNTSWRFVPANHSFANPLNPFETVFPETLEVQVMSDPIANLDFTAIKTGDVNNTAIPNLTTASEARSFGEVPVSVTWLGSVQTSMPDLNLGVEDHNQNPPPIFAENTFMEAVLTIESLAPTATQFTLQFNPEQLVFEKIEPLMQDISSENFGLNHLKEGLLTFSYAPNNLKYSDGQTASYFKIIFKKKGQGAGSNNLRLVDWPTPSLVYLANGISLKPFLITDNPDATFLLAPNPFGRDGVSIISNTRGTMEVFDAGGFRLFSKDIVPNEAIRIHSEVFPGAGVYFWRIGEQAGKLIFAP
ncbi:MAG: hypothetical protein ACKVT2_13250 [Saprospiraceae bacterium]